MPAGREIAIAIAIQRVCAERNLNRDRPLKANFHACFHLT